MAGSDWEMMSRKEGEGQETKERKKRRRTKKKNEGEITKMTRKKYKKNIRKKIGRKRREGQSFFLSIINSSQISDGLAFRHKFKIEKK